VFSPPSPGQTRRFAGAPTDVDFQGADLRWVLRLLGHDIGKINVVIDPSVSSNAKVDLTLTQVAWDEIFDIVCRTNQLKWEVGGNVVRVLSADVAQLLLTDAMPKPARRPPRSASKWVVSAELRQGPRRREDAERDWRPWEMLKAQFNERSEFGAHHRSAGGY
jgi:hypothetical protein